MSLDVRNLLKVTATSAAVAAAVQAGTAVLALKRERRDYADVAWGPGLAGIAVTSALIGNGDPVRRWTTAAATTAWAARLGHLMWGRVRGKDEEDPRYQEFLEGDGPAQVVTKVFLTQGLAQLLVSAPIQVAAASALPKGKRRWLFPLGLAVMGAGAAIEAIADRQKDAYMARDRDERPDVLDTGLWGWSRHPNYFGDSVFWDGAYVAAAASSPAGWTFPAPVAMSYFLVYATGARRTEKRMQERPGYRDYQERVSFFVPLPGGK
jgi:steroid 5-alpha reductase family enzyme